MPLPPGTTLSDLMLTSLSGHAVPFSRVWSRGRGLLALGHADCATTRLALPYVDRIYRRLGSGVLAVLQDDPVTARELVAELGLDLPMCLDADPYPLSEHLRIETVPTMFLTEEGTVVRVVEGFDRAQLDALAAELGAAGPLFTAGDGAPAYRPG